MKKRCECCGKFRDIEEMTEIQGVWYCNYCYDAPWIFIPEKPLSAYNCQMDIFGNVQWQFILTREQVEQTIKALQNIISQDDNGGGEP